MFKVVVASTVMKIMDVGMRVGCDGDGCFGYGKGCCGVHVVVLW